MTADVAKIITGSGNPLNEGSVVMGVNKFGSNHVIPPTVNAFISPEDLEIDLEDRFDDPRFYSGDTDS